MDETIAVITYSKTKEELLQELKNHCKKVKEVKNPTKRGRIFDRLNKLIDFITHSLEETHNYIYTVSDRVDKQVLSPSYCEEWSLPKYQILYDNPDLHNYIQDLLDTTNLKHGIHVDKKIIHYVGTKYKKKVLREYSSFDDISKIKVKFILYGKAKPVSNALRVVNKNLKWSEVIDEFETYEMKILHNKLSEVFKMIENPATMDKLIFQTEIKEAIECYRIKELYLDIDYDLEIPEDANFNVYRVKQLEINDPASELKKSYGGIIAVSYF